VKKWLTFAGQKGKLTLSRRNRFFDKTASKGEVQLPY